MASRPENSVRHRLMSELPPAESCRSLPPRGGESLYLPVTRLLYVSCPMPCRQEEPENIISSFDDKVFYVPILKQNGLFMKILLH